MLKFCHWLVPSSSLGFLFHQQPSSTAHHKYLIFTAKVDHFQRIILFRSSCLYYPMTTNGCLLTRLLTLSGTTPVSKISKWKICWTYTLYRGIGPFESKSDPIFWRGPLFHCHCYRFLSKILKHSKILVGQGLSQICPALILFTCPTFTKSPFWCFECQSNSDQLLISRSIVLQADVIK